jgi:hypothetical protein
MTIAANYGTRRRNLVPCGRNTDFQMIGAGLAFLLAVATATAGPATGRVTVYPAPEGSPVSRDYTVTIGGKAVDIYAVGSARFGICDIDGPVEAVVTADFLAAEAVHCMSLHPLSMRIEAERDGRTLRFSVKKPCTITVLVNGRHGDRALHLFLNPPAPPVPDDAVYFGPGKHALDPGKPITLTTGQTLYIAGGAWVEGIVTVRKADNITITGRGVLFPTVTSPVQYRRGIRVYDSQNVKIEGITIARTSGPGWCSQLINCDDVAVRFLHVVAPARPSTDGINPCNSRNVLIEDCFFRTGDDCIAIKGNTAGPVATSRNIHPNTQPPVENITVRRCQMWSEFNNVICIGAETWARHFDGIRFKDCDILLHASRRSGTISILPCVGAPIRNIVFENIRVEQTISDLFVFRIADNMYFRGNHAFPGDISDVTIKNIRVGRHAGKPRSIFGSAIEGKQIRNVTIKGLRYGDMLVTNAKQMGLSRDARVSNVRFLDEPVPGAPEPELRSAPDPRLGRFWFTFASGFHPEKGRGTSGVHVRLEAREHGREENATLLDTHIAPGRDWRTHAVNLSDYVGKKTVLRFSVGPGVDTKNDWYQWGEPRIIELTKDGDRVLLGSAAIVERAGRGLIGWPYGSPMPLSHGAVMRPRVSDDRKTWLVVGGVRKPGVILHPAYEGVHREPVFLQWEVDLERRALHEGP